MARARRRSRGRVIVHTGEGRAFQTGVDVSELATDGLGMERYRESVEKWDLHFTVVAPRVNKPVITAVNGICAGGGFHWVADADIVIAASNAQFFDPHVSVGQVVAIEAIGLLRKMPFEAVMRMALVGRFERMSAPARRARHDLPDRRPTREPAGRGTEARRDHRAELARGDASPRSARWGALEMGLTDACRAGARELVNVGRPTNKPKAPGTQLITGQLGLGDPVQCCMTECSIGLHLMGQQQSRTQCRQAFVAPGCLASSTVSSCMMAHAQAAPAKALAEPRSVSPPPHLPDARHKAGHFLDLFKPRCSTHAQSDG